eukprot:1139868-Pelagomonas_calceolata.AAC.1
MNRLAVKRLDRPFKGLSDPLKCNMMASGRLSCVVYRGLWRGGGLLGAQRWIPGGGESGRPGVWRTTLQIPISSRDSFHVPEGIADFENGSEIVIGPSVEALPITSKDGRKRFSGWLGEVSAMSGVFAAWRASASAPSFPRTCAFTLNTFSCYGTVPVR